MSTLNERPVDPEGRLAELMERDLGVKIEPKALRLFLLHRWKAVSLFAHGVHDAGIVDEAFSPGGTGG